MRSLLFSAFLLCVVFTRAQTASGNYIPVVLSTVNAGSITMGYCHWWQIDSLIFVSGQLHDEQYDTPGGQRTTVRISIPVPSNLLAYPTDTFGTGTVAQTGNIQPINALCGNVAGAADRVAIWWYRTTAFPCSVSFSFSYIIRN